MLALASSLGVAQNPAKKPGASTPAPSKSAPAIGKAEGYNPHAGGAKAVSDEINTWIKPLYKTAKGQQKTITQVDKFPYREQVYQPPVTIKGLAKSQYRYVTPEDAMVSRFSAMMNGDYEGWLASWDAKSQRLLKQLDAEPNRGPDKRIAQWKGLFEKAKPVLIRRIQTGQYVIITYKLLTADGKDAGMFEFPTVLHEVGGLWSGTEDLSGDALPTMSPWVSGKLADEVDIRPLSEAVIK